MGLSMIAIGICGIPVYASIANRFGKRLAMMAVLVSSIVVFVATWWLYDPTKPWLQTFASGFIAFTQAGFWMLYGSIGADIIDYDEAETGKRREGAFTACGSWIMKFGQAIALTATGWLLKATGFDQALGANQTEQSLFWIRFLLAAIPVCGLVLGMIALMRYGLTPQKLAEIRAKLEARRGRV
jgi:GPH family glycoside/pentoside/hexuronide:cation symporter